ncbi:MAG: family 20 glycosylhydrolase [Bryobacterales bacterium]|nr:family 20 glycosylhydrolase [Bryobacterales bacterium]
MPVLLAIRFAVIAALLALLTGLGSAASTDADRLPILPYPARVSGAEGFLAVQNGFRVHVDGPVDPLLEQTVARFLERLSAKTGIRFLAPRAADQAMATLRIRSTSPTPVWPGLREDEAYVVEVRPEGATLQAANAFGIRHGLETFLQLVEFGAGGAMVSALRIEDQPRFPWRGLMLDPVRHFLPLDVLKRQVDAMAAVKLNVLHFRFADDQAFRVESKRFPKLHEAGAEGQFYTQEQIRELVEYARQRGIRVVPEFCVPGHTAAWLVGYPEFGSRPGPYTLIRSFGIFEPTMDPTNEALYPFLDELFGEMAGLFPDSFVHIGGDEITGKHWAETPRIRAFMEERGMKGWPDLQAHFNKRLLPLLNAHGKRVIGWDEVLHPDLPRSIVVQSWRGQKELGAAVRDGHEGILSSGYYLDLMLPAESHYAVDPLSNGGDALSSDEASRVLGGETCAWSEFITAENLELKLWPRGAAIAERLWSPRERMDVPFLYARFPRLLEELGWLGVEPERIRRRMLARAANDSDSLDRLTRVAEFLEPVKRYHRADSGDYTVFRPLNRLVDALWPESMAARGFRLQVDAAVGTPNLAALAAVRVRLEGLEADARSLSETVVGSALLNDAAGDVERLAQSAALAADAVRYLEAGKKTPPGWLERARTSLSQMEARQGEILNMLFAPAHTLLDALSRSPAEQGTFKDSQP